MKLLVRYLRVDFMKTRRLPIRLAHILIPIGASAVFLAYYTYSPWSAFQKAAAYFQALGAGYPFLIGLFCAITADQEASAGAFQAMLSLPERKTVFYSKLLLLSIFGFVSVILACVLFGTGYYYLLKQQIMDYGVYWLAPFVIWGSSLFLYILHLFLAMRFHKGLSIGLGIVESLAAALMLTGIGDSIWPYIPAAWPSRLVSLLLFKQRAPAAAGNGGGAAVLICAAVTLLAVFLYGIWSCRWQGEKSEE